ncbi:MAG: phosphatidylserine decarboxylase [Planctomycetes bacterium]|nr:phosphatidylserine decarboxylase [Planctomycetota bacterium]
MPDPRFLLTLPGAPRRLISRCAGALARTRLPLGVRRRLWPWLSRRLGIAAEDVPGEWGDYRSFLELFTRPLAADSRPLPNSSSWLSPADGALVSVSPLCPEGTWLIKGCPYSTGELLPGAEPRRLAGYHALQIYLAPRDYHRYHAPCDLTVESAWSGPGELQPVDPALVRRSMRVLVTNRRVLLHCRDAQGEWLGLLFVGALNVGRMRFGFDRSLGAAPMSRGQRRYDPPVALAAGDELGLFELGSTVVLFAPPGLRPLVEVGGRTLARTPLLAPEGATEH